MSDRQELFVTPKMFSISRLMKLAIACSVLAGCGSGHVDTFSPSTPLPTPPAVSNTSSYVGSQDPGSWTMTLDDLQKAYIYESATTATSNQGSFFQTTNGILNLGNAKGASLGMAAELPGRAALLRPGDNTTFPVPMVPQSDCFAITGKQRYIFSIPSSQSNSTSFDSIGYGTFVASTSSDGSAWNFEDLHSYVLTDYVHSAGTEDGREPVTFSAGCSGKNGQSAVTLPSTTVFNQQPLPTFNFHSAGSFEASSAGNTWIGFAMPSTAISPADVAKGIYAGFVYESNDYTKVHTQPVYFLSGPAGNKVLFGGVYPNDDLTQPPGGEYSITLGTQDAALNGVFPSATFTAYDVNGACSLVAFAQGSTSVVHSSFDVTGRAICTALGVATVSSFEGKYVIYFTSYDGTPISPTGQASQAYPIQFFLYQQ